MAASGGAGLSAFGWPRVTFVGPMLMATATMIGSPIPQSIRVVIAPPPSAGAFGPDRIVPGNVS